MRLSLTVGAKPLGARCVVWLLLLSLTACGGGGGGSQQPAAEDPGPADPAQPNILVIMADDLGYNDLGANGGDTLVDTPRLDAFASEGLRFTRHYSYAVCAPARVALLTGRHPGRVGFFPNGRGISAEFETLAARLAAAGYATSHVGKWHSGSLDRAAWPDRQGFSTWFGYLNQWRLAGVTGEDGDIVRTRPRYFDPWLQGSEEPGAFYAGHLESIVRDRALEEISRLQGDRRPWFLNLWFYAPHEPLQPAEPYASDYPDTDAGRYRALVRQLDDNVGRVLDHLASQGAADNTIVVFVSDNGALDDRGLASNAPFVGEKGQFLEGGLRTPLVIRGLDSALAGATYDGVTSILDIFPTLLAAASVAIPTELDGHNLLPVLRGDAPGPQRHLFWEGGAGQYSVLSPDGRWRLLRGRSLEGLAAPALYDLETDPSGFTVADAEHAGEASALQSAFAQWHRAVHRLAVQYRETPFGASVTGVDLQRTPGYSEFAVGVPIPAGFEGRIAGQEGVWELAVAGGTVTAIIEGKVLTGDLAAGRSCHSILLTGDFRATSLEGPVVTESELALYLNGQLADSRIDAAIFAARNVQEETTFGDPLITAPIARPGMPIFLNVSVSPDSEQTPLELDTELCGDVP